MQLILNRKKQYYLENKERIIKSVKSYYQKNRGRKIQYQLEYIRKRNKPYIYDEDAKLKKKEYYQKNKDRILKYEKSKTIEYLAKQNERQKAKSKTSVIDLNEKYVVSLIHGKGKRKPIQINNDVIEVKKALILLKREIKLHAER